MSLLFKRTEKYHKIIDVVIQVVYVNNAKSQITVSSLFYILFSCFSNKRSHNTCIIMHKHFNNTYTHLHRGSSVIFPYCYKVIKCQWNTYYLDGDTQHYVTNIYLNLLISTSEKNNNFDINTI